MSIVISGVAKSFGDQQLFTGIDITISSGEKVALIGRNGSGKSTLLKIITGLEEPDQGTLVISGSVAMLQQHGHAGRGTVLDSVVPARIRQAEAQLKATQARLRDPSAENLREYANAEEEYRTLGGYDFEVCAASILAGLGLDPGWDAQGLSGGEQRRVMFAQLLLAPTDILVLDEPTNHLDVSSREWLETWLKESPATIVFVSHDRAFLDNTAHRVLELERTEVKDWPGNYTQAMQLKATAEAAARRSYEAQERKQRSLTAEMHRLGSQARSADRFNHKRASGQPLILAKAKAENVSRTLAGRKKALEKRLERMNEVRKPFDDTLTVTVPLPDVVPGPAEVIAAEDFTPLRNGTAVLKPMTLHLRRGDRIAVTGPNGSGKSSLLLGLTGHLAHEGTVSLGQGLTIFEAWQHGEELTVFDTVGEAIRAAQPGLRDQDVFHLLGQLHLPSDLSFRISDLSGGQRSKLALARLAVTRAQLLVLDEPTNDLDLEAIGALEKVLSTYPGTVLFASHDRRLVARIATAVWKLPAVDRRI